MANASRRTTQCCIVGGGPAGMVLGLLLARAGVEVMVLEKHGDFLRDFRGDTLHPSTLELFHELGLLERLLAIPHQEIAETRGVFGGYTFTTADFHHLPTHCRFVALMPQWDFLDFVAREAQRYPGFHLWMEAEVTGLLGRNGGAVEGVRAELPLGSLEVVAPLTIGADGRTSLVRERAGLQARVVGSSLDLLWMRFTRHANESGTLTGHFGPGHVLALFPRGDYWQCGLVIPKGGLEQVHQQGLERLRRELVQLVPALEDRVTELRSWDDVKLLTVKVDRLRRWYREGLLCIGDAAHAMSPVGGVGINLAIQDAIAAARLLAGPLRAGSVPSSVLRKIQRRRSLPTWLTQRLQTLVQEGILRPSLEPGAARTGAPWPARLLTRWPILRRIPGRLIGMGVRPEHLCYQDEHPQRSPPRPSRGRKSAMATKECIFTDRAPEPGHYSQAIRHNGLVYLSGQVSEDPATGEVVRGSVAAQTRRILTNLETILEASGSSLRDVLKVTIFLTDIRKKPEMNEVYREFFPVDPPARIAVAVHELDEGLDVEMDAIAAVST